jgi:hypothetical protein
MPLFKRIEPIEKGKGNCPYTAVFGEKGSYPHFMNKVLMIRQQLLIPRRLAI